ncbi:NACHT domain-containing protein [Kitasatospora sp. NPDC004289]
MGWRRILPWGRAGAGARVDVGGAGAVGVGRDVVHGAIGPQATAVHNEVTVYVGEGPAAALTEGEVERALAAYLARVRESQRRLDLDVLGPGDAAGELPQIELRQVFVPQLSRPFEARIPDDLRRLLTEAGELVEGPLPPGLDSAMARQLSDQQRAVTPRPVLEVLADGAARRLVVLGDPGAGKSTLAKYLALALAGALDRPPQELAPLAGYVPLLVELRQYAQERWRERSFEDFLDHVHEQGRMELPRPVLDHLLAHGRAVVVFDGLDEVFDPGLRAETARRIAAFATGRPEVRTVVTSREYGYRSHEFSSAGFSQVMLRDLERAQVEEFVRRWYAAAHPGEPELASRLARRLLDAVREVRAVGELASNPLLLTILASIGLGRTIPRERRKVYEHAVEVLIGRWDRDAKFLTPPGPTDAEAARAVEWLTTARRFRLLERIARRMQDSADRPSGTYVRHDELIEIVVGYLTDHHIGPVAADIAARHVVDHLRTRNFILAHFGGGIYGFVHRTFLEYLAANDVLNRRDEEEWDRQELLDHLGRHTTDPAWHEVILLTVGGLRQRDAAAFLQHLLQDGKGAERRAAALQLAVRALAERDDFETAPPPGAPGRHLSLTVQGHAVIDALVMAAFDGGFRGTGETRAALRSVSHFWGGRSRYLRWYHAGACETDSRLGETSAETAALLARGVDELVAQTRIPWSAELRTAALTALGGHWADHDGVLAELLAAAAGEFPDNRAAALWALRRWPDSEEVLDAALGALADDHREVRTSALRLLAADWSDRSEVFDAVLAVAVDERSAGRAEAIDSLVPYCPVHEAARAAIMTALTDELPTIRSAAVGALGRLPNDRAVQDRILAAAADDDFRVRLAALLALDPMWPDDGAALEAALAGAEDDHHEVRSMALFCLATRWEEREEVLRATLAATADRHEEVRKSGVYVLGAYWAHREEAFHAVLAAATAGDPEIQGLALLVLGSWWGERAESFETVLAVASDGRAEAQDSAVRTLADHWGDREEAFEVIRAAAAAPHHDARVSALNVLADRWADREAVLPVLLGAFSDPHHEVREQALRQCVRYWPERGEVAAAVARAVTDDHHEVRALALVFLAMCRADEPGTSAMAVAGTADEHPEVRTAALQALAALQPAQHVRLILDRASRDEASKVRITALRLAASILPQDPGTRELLTELVEDADEEVAAAAREALPLLDLPRPSLLP